MGQWILLIVFGLISLSLGLIFLAVAIFAVRDFAFDRYGLPMVLTLAVSVLFGSLARNRAYRLVGKAIPRGSGGGTYV